MRVSTFATLAALVVFTGVSAGCSTFEPRAGEAAAAAPVPAAHDHDHGAAGASAGAGMMMPGMAEHMREMESAIREARTILEGARGATDPAQLRTALDGVGAQIDAMQNSMTRCKSMMHEKK